MPFARVDLALTLYCFGVQFVFCSASGPIKSLHVNHHSLQLRKERVEAWQESISSSCSLSAPPDHATKCHLVARPCH